MPLHTIGACPPAWPNSPHTMKSLGAHREAGNPYTSVARTRTVVHVEEPVLSVLRVERQTEQTLFIAAIVHRTRDVQERGRKYLSVRLEDLDRSRLLHDEEAGIPTMGDVHRFAEPGYDRLQLKGL